MQEALEDILARAKGLRKTLKAETGNTVNKTAIREEAKALGSLWHKEISAGTQGILSADSKANYDQRFTRLIRLSSPNNQVSSYLDALDGIIKPFKTELLIPAQQGAFGVEVRRDSDFDKFFSTITNDEENDYLKEAIACAKQGFLRAAVVLGWSAAVDRIHRRIEATGFKHFNVVSAQMASQQTGRYKKFNQTQNVNSLSEIRDVFDNIILWIIEGMTMIDSNQHTRLKSCFEMRCQCAHPGDAPITTYNLLSFFSDLDQIIFQNPKFKVS